MSRLHPSGAVRVQYDQDVEDRRHTDRQRLAAALEEYKIDGAKLRRVERLVDLFAADQPEVSPAFLARTKLLLVMVLVETEQGSTRFPLAETGHVAERLEELHELLATDEADAPSPLFRSLVDLDEPDYPALAADLQSLAREEARDWLAGGPGDYRPLIEPETDGALYTQKLYARESSVVDQLSDIWRRVTTPDGLQAAAGEVVDNLPFEPADGYAGNVATLADSPVGILTGGPGTGKTTMVAALLRTLVRAGVSPDGIELAAPTGKAAKRMQNAVEDHFKEIGETEGAELSADDHELQANLRDARTIHRLLEYSPRGGWGRDRNDPLDAEIVVIDEASMVDLHLMDAFLRALHGAGDDEPPTRLVLVGDADQLPAVGTGAVFAELCEGPGPLEQGLVELEGNKRIETGETDEDDDSGARAIASLAAAIQGESSRTIAEGDEPDGWIGEGQGRSRAWDDEQELAEEFRGVDFLVRETSDAEEEDDEGVPTAFLDRWYEQYVKLAASADEPVDDHDGHTNFYRSREAFDLEDGEFTDPAKARIEQLLDHYERARLLTLTRVRETGADAINRYFRRRYLADHNLDRGGWIRAGEPVMVTQNNYEYEVFNGERGIVLYTRTERERRDDDLDAKKRVVFETDDGLRQIRHAHISDILERCYAMTVHKSQGSEFDHVGLMLPNRPTPLLTRELLYTAVTRAKSRVTIFGSPRWFARGAATASKRFSGLADRLEHRC